MRNPYATENERKRVERRKAEGGCIRCPSPARPGRGTCEPCAARSVGWHREREKGNRARGLCSCGAPPAHRRKACEKCLEKSRRKNARKISPTEGRRRGRRLQTETGRRISHEEFIISLAKRTALDMVLIGLCQCGKDIRSFKGKGERPVVCDACAYRQRLAKKRVKDPARKAGARPISDDLAAAKQLLWRTRQSKKRQARK